MVKFFHSLSKENSVRGASILLIVTLTLSNVLGLLRDHFLAKNIDTYYLDIYYASFQLPDLIFNFLILGAITSAFIPVFSDFIAKKEYSEGWKVANSLLNLAIIIMIAMAGIFFLLMPYIIPFIVPRFDSYRLAETIKMSRIIMLTPIFFSVSYILGGMLNSFKRFFAYSLAPLFYNLSIIVGAVFLAPRFGIKGVVISVVAGAVLHGLIQLPAVLKLGFKPRAILDWQSKSLRKIIKLMIPRTLGMGANQLMLVAFTAIASALAAGSITAFNLANNIQTMPVVVLGTSFATAIFPTLAHKIAENNKEEFSLYLNKAIRVVAYLLIPSTVIFILLRAQIVRIILGSGEFSWNDTRATAITLAVFSLSLLAQGLIPMLSRAYYAMKDTKTPMYASILTAVISAILAYPLSVKYSVAGLALAFSIGSYFNLIFLGYYLNKKDSFFDFTLVKTFAKITIWSVVMGLIVWGTMHYVANFVDMSRFWGIFIQTVISGTIGLVIYLLLSLLFQSDELNWALTRRINGERRGELSGEDAN